MTKKIPTRSEIDDRYKWKIEKVYPDQKAWQTDLDKAKQMLPQANEYRGHLGDLSLIHI